MLKYAHLIGAVRLPTHSLIDGKLKDAVFNNVATPIDVFIPSSKGWKNSKKQSKKINTLSMGIISRNIQITLWVS